VRWGDGHGQGELAQLRVMVPEVEGVVPAPLVDAQGPEEEMAADALHAEALAAEVEDGIGSCEFGGEAAGEFPAVGEGEMGGGCPWAGRGDADGQVPDAEDQQLKEPFDAGAMGFLRDAVAAQALFEVGAHFAERQDEVFGQLGRRPQVGLAVGMNLRGSGVHLLQFGDPAAIGLHKNLMHGRTLLNKSGSHLYRHIGTNWPELTEDAAAHGKWCSGYEGNNICGS
jgi:hypothetical protein